MVWSEEGRRLSQRLQVMADKIDPGETCTDVGSDHGYLGLYLWEKGISPSVILTDISESSLAKAKAAAGTAQFGSEESFRVGDGLKVLKPGETDCVVIAGMGGKLIRQILSEDPEKTRSFRKFVLQPRTASGPLRKWLLEAGFVFLSEDIVREGNHLPEIITVSPGGHGDFDPGDFDYFERVQGVDLAAGIRNALVREETGIADSVPEAGIADSVPDVGIADSAPEAGASEDPADLDLPGEDSIHFSVPMWILNAGGPVIEYLERKMKSQEDVLSGLSRANRPDEGMRNRAEYNIEYLRQLIELKKLMEKSRERRRQSNE